MLTPVVIHFSYFTFVPSTGTHTNSFPFLFFITNPLFQSVDFWLPFPQFASSVFNAINPAGIIGLSYVVSIPVIVVFISVISPAFAFVPTVICSDILTFPALSLASTYTEYAVPGFNSVNVYVVLVIASDIFASPTVGNI